jgi:hypothetical protein
MSYFAADLITRSWYLSGIVSRNLQTPTGSQMSDGLYLLNALLDYKQIETDLIPYWTYLEIPLIPHQEYYFLPNICDIELTTFNIGTVRYPMESTSRRKYFGSSRVDHISTLPFDWQFNRGEGGGTLSLYFKPAANYSLKMMVKIFLTDVLFTTDLTNISSTLTVGEVNAITITNPGINYTLVPTVTITGGNGTGALASATINTSGQIIAINIINAGSGYTQVPTVTITGNGTDATATANVINYKFIQTQNAGYDTSYIEYLRYALAQYMCSEFGVNFNEESRKLMDKLAMKLMYVSPPDLSMKKSSTLTAFRGFNWGDVNIGHGWRPD